MRVYRAIQTALRERFVFRRMYRNARANSASVKLSMKRAADCTHFDVYIDLKDTAHKTLVIENALKECAFLLSHLFDDYHATNATLRDLVYSQKMREIIENEYKQTQYVVFALIERHAK